MSLAEVVSPYVGLVTELDELLPSPDDARHFHAVAAPAASLLTLGADGPRPRSPGSGYGHERGPARAAAVGEALERYAAAYVPESVLVEATARELGSAAAAPESFALFAPEQYRAPGFPFVPFTADTRLRWVPAVRLRDGAHAWLPAQLVYLGFRFDEPQIAYATSNGLAAAPTWRRSLLAALLELVERDAFMLAWNARLSFPLLDWQRSHDLRSYYARHLAPALARLTTLDLSSVHEIPVVVALVRGRRGALGVGAAAAPSVEEAWRKAVTEAFAVRTAARELAIREPRPPFAPDFRDVRDFRDHIQVYAYPEHAGRAAFLEASDVRNDPARVPRLRARVDDVVALLARKDIETYAVDVTSPDVREAGVTVVRAVAPSLIPLDVRHDGRFLGGKRLRNVPLELGYAAEPLSFEDFNPDPHPFP